MLSCEIFEVFKETYFEEHLRMTASGIVLFRAKRKSFNNLFVFLLLCHDFYKSPVTKNIVIQLGDTTILRLPRETSNGRLWVDV